MFIPSKFTNIFLIILGDIFNFPREKNKRLGVNLISEGRSQRLPSVEEIKIILENAKHDALTNAKDLGMTLEENMQKEALEKILMPTNEIYDPTEELTEDEFTIEEIEDGNISEEYLSEIEDEMKIFSNVDLLNIKDFKSTTRGIAKNSNKAVLKITINNKKDMLVKKSTLCWLFSDKSSRLSNDRILRVKGMTNKKTSGNEKPLKKNNKTTQKNRKNSDEVESETSESDSYESESEMEEEDFEEEKLEVNNEPENEPEDEEISITVENYYVENYYDNMWYIGRVLDIHKNVSKVKFLKYELDSYIWPHEDDIHNVENHFIFHGPVSLLGSGPFQLKRFEKNLIEKKYKKIKADFRK